MLVFFVGEDNMKFRKNNMFRKFKQYLVKKVIVNNYSVQDDFLIFRLQLSNFWRLKKEIKAYLINEDEYQELSYQLEKNTLSLKVPIKSLHKFEYRGKIELFINNKKMWIKPDVDFNKDRGSLIVNRQYYSINVKKNINIKSLFNEYEFNSNGIKINDLEVEYNCIKLTINCNLPDMEDTQLEVLGFSNHKVRRVDCDLIQLANDKQLVMKDFNTFSIGTWQLFLRMGNQLYPIKMNRMPPSVLKTYNHEVEIIKKLNNMYLQFNPHLIKSEAVTINRVETGRMLQFDCEELKNISELTLLIEDTRNRSEIQKPVFWKSTGFTVNISSEELYEGLSTKRFFIVQNGTNPIKYQFDLENTVLLGTGVVEEETINSQLVKITFYKRKDKSLGLKMKFPKLVKVIKEIDDFSLKGNLGSLEKFVDCQAFLLIEDRNSLEAIKYPIDGEFEINLDADMLIKIKSKEKTILDFFVIIQDNDNEVIRKEKIKYELADYKKDNYYDHKVAKDIDKNQHHFLLTTTPFNNLKVETFSIPHYINIPEDTSEKDPNIWLLGERYNTAQDNGFALFNWLQENTTIEAYYVIESESEDYEKIKHNPYVLAFGSTEHYEISFKAKVLLGTHDLENLLPYKPARGFFHYEQTYRVFLQHGVLGRKNVEYHKKYYDLPFHLFIVSSDPEKYNVVMEKLGYEDDEVAVTGLARFDNLIQDKKPEDILLMPTWRDWINTDYQFLSSKYYAAYSSLINNKKLLSLLEYYDVNLNFYPHYRAQEYFSKDVMKVSDRIKFIPLGSKSVQQLLIDNALLITDYSSVSFDFTLMNKPVIYYHFDVKRFFRKGKLRPIEETFIGGIAKSEEELIELIEERLKHGLKNFDHDISNIIKYQDAANCERIFNAVSLSIKSAQENGRGSL